MHQTISLTILFLIMRNTSIQETQLISEALKGVAALLPASWRLEETVGVSNQRVDAVLELVAPSGERVEFVVEAKKSRSLPIDALLLALLDLRRSTSLPVLLATDYIGPALRSALVDQGLSYADATGWVRLTSEDPLILLTGQGANKAPRPRATNAVVRMNGVATSRIIRALVNTALPVGVRELAELADVSPGSISKLLATLSAESIIDRDERGAVRAIRRRALIERWIRDYSFAKTNPSINYFLAPRGLDAALKRLPESKVPIALTGSAAARRLLPVGTTPVVPLRLLAVYVADPAALADELRLVDADSATANVVLAVPQDAGILPLTKGEPMPAPTALVLADLLTLPGRSNAEAEQLMDALVGTDPAWKE